MQETLLIFTICAGAVAFIYGRTSHTPWAYFVAAFFFFIAGIGILQTGYETYEGGTITLNEVSDTEDTISFEARTITASLSGSADNQILYLAGHIFLVLTLGIFAMGANEAWLNHEARRASGE